MFAFHASCGLPFFVATNIPKWVKNTPKQDIRIAVPSALVAANSHSNYRKEPHMSVPASPASAVTPLQRFEFVVAEANLAIARNWADTLGVPLAYLYADNADLAEVILAFGLLPEAEQRRLAVELKVRVSSRASDVRPEREARTASCKR
ncbi:hypothetical protein [Lysobacter sp. CA199]|uniref:hypothetical protein n=1 Tax=Lysobacter sp. CA199 TaxID=3455608 RepID=UPI003F8D0BFC